MLQKHLLILMLCYCTISLSAQINRTDSTQIPKQCRFRASKLIIPGIFISYGILGMKVKKIGEFNTHIKETVNSRITRKRTIDDYTQYLPTLSVYGLNALGIKGQHNMKEVSIILATSLIITGTTVLTVKYLTAIERPDGSTKNSFPSGHTAMAFVGAELLYQEYKDVSLWYGVGGYTIAAATGLLRVHNDRHWVTDIIAGAGVGVLSTKIAYWLKPYIANKLFKKSDKKRNKMALSPFYNNRVIGLGFSMTF